MRVIHHWIVFSDSKGRDGLECDLQSILDYIIRGGGWEWLNLPGDFGDTEHIDSRYTIARGLADAMATASETYCSERIPEANIGELAALLFAEEVMADAGGNLLKAIGAA